MTEEQEENTTPIYGLTVFGVTVAQFKTEKMMLEWKKAFEDEPFLFLKNHEWQAEDWMLPYISFKEDKENDAVRTNG